MTDTPTASKSTNTKPATGKDSWPKTPAGTVDWETVFEHPETGLLAQIAGARTPQELRDTALAIIKQLFARKGDEEEAARLSAELTELITDDMPADRIALVLYAITATFRRIKEFRQKKAAEYELAKASKEAIAAERRTAAQSQQSIKRALARKKQLRMMLIAASVVLAVGLGVSGYFYFRGPQYPPSADRILLQQMRSAAAGGTARTHIYGGALQTRRYLGDISITAEAVPIDACVSVGVELAKSGTYTINGNLLSYVSVDSARSLCQGASAPITIIWVPAH